MPNTLQIRDVLPLRYNWLYYRLQQRIIKTDVHINATTGSTGAGVSPSETTHFSWRSNNMSHYKAFDHQHLGEINQSVNQLQADYTNELIFCTE
jgi:N-acetyl-gamma-glutamyl-phosphate reductase